MRTGPASEAVPWSEAGEFPVSKPAQPAHGQRQRLAISRKIFVAGRELSCCFLPPRTVNTLTPALAVIDGSLCRLTREGNRREQYAPLATAVVEFRQRPMRVIVREHPYGLLPGLPNLYCLDGAFRLKWMAEWPDASDPCIRIVEDQDDLLRVESASGALIELDAHTGRVAKVTRPLAAAV